MLILNWSDMVGIIRTYEKVQIGKFTTQMRKLDVGSVL